MDFNEFKLKVEEIEREIYAIKNDAIEIYGIVDGVINPEKYLAAKYKILWILREPYGDDGGWSLTEELNKKVSWSEQPKSGRPTFKPMVYVSYGILNNFVRWSSIPEIEDNSVFQTIHQISYINVKKLPNVNSSKSNHIEIADAYQKNRTLLIKQLEIYNPDIIIGGGTLGYFYNDLLLIKKDKSKIIMGDKYCYFDNHRLYIDAFHPSQISITQQAYVDEIIGAVEKWRELCI